MGWFHVSKKRKRGVHSKFRSGWLEQLVELLWPSMGWKAMGRFLLLKLRREAANPHKVAFGVAIGVGISFLPIPGLGLVLAVLLAWVLRASIPAAAIGQLVGNPWTFPLIWWATLEIGRGIWPGDGALNWGEMINQMNWEFIGTHMGALINNLVIPLMIGGLVLGSLLGMLTYVAVYWEILKFGEKKKKARKRG